MRQAQVLVGLLIAVSVLGAVAFSWHAAIVTRRNRVAEALAGIGLAR